MHADEEPHVTGIPHVFTTLFLITIVAVLATWTLPAGVYERIHAEGAAVSSIVPGTYAKSAANPIPPTKIAATLYHGMISAADTVFFIFIAFSSIAVVVSTGAFHAVIAKLLGKFRGRAKIFVIPLFITLIGMASSTIAVFEEMFPFIPLFVAAAIAMGYDALVGMSIVALGIGLGYSGAFLNPFTVVIAQDIAGLPPFSGAQFRFFCHLAMIAISSLYVMLYALRVEDSPRRSLVYGLNINNEHTRHIEERIYEDHRLDIRHIFVLLAMLVGISVIIFGVMDYEWHFAEIAGIYLLMAIVSGAIMGWTPDKIAHKWADSAAEITTTCLKVAMTKGIILILTEGNVMDTLTHAISTPLLMLPRWAATEAMLLIQTLMNFFIPSGSGQAVVSMPIMVPLADVLGVSRQVAVLAFQFGDGISNVLWITGSMPVICKFASVPPRRWIRFFLPLFGLIYLVQMCCLKIALSVGY